MNRYDYDMIIIGAGISGIILAEKFTDAGLKCLLLEAGAHWNKHTYPRKDIDANSRLYWGGGVELNSTADLAILRPKTVGGGSIVNQALVDRFDENAFDPWREESGVDFFSPEKMLPWYELAESKLVIQKIPEKFRNKNAEIFRTGFERNGYQCAPLSRAQKDCKFEEGNDCIECLAGCRIDSKQSAAITVLPRALENGLTLEPEFEVKNLSIKPDLVKVTGINRFGEPKTYASKFVTLAASSIGNSKLLLASGYGEKNPNIGQGFYTHPQFMLFAVYAEEINAHKGPLQSYKSADPNFRLNRFKLENVFAPPVGAATILPGLGAKHQALMAKYHHLACVETAVRDQNAGRIRVRGGKLEIEKRLYGVDLETKKKGIKAIVNIFRETGALEIIDGTFGLGLHLMGGCGIGVDPANSVVSPEFTLHGHKNAFCADSSVFPNAPGINPSLTIMALSRKAGEEITRGKLR